MSNYNYFTIYVIALIICVIVEYLPTDNMVFLLLQTVPKRALYKKTDFQRLLWAQPKWWLAPLVFILLIVSLLVLFADSAVAPFIYSLF